MVCIDLLERGGFADEGAVSLLSHVSDTCFSFSLLPRFDCCPQSLRGGRRRHRVGRRHRRDRQLSHLPRLYPQILTYTRVDMVGTVTKVKSTFTMFKTFQFHFPPLTSTVRAQCVRLRSHNGNLMWFGFWGGSAFTLPSRTFCEI